MKLGEIIKTYRFEHKLSLRDFANQCGTQRRDTMKKAPSEEGVVSPDGFDVSSVACLAKQEGLRLVWFLRL